MTKAKITVEIELENGQKDKLEFNNYDVRWSHERGHCTILNQHGHKIEIQATEQQRFSIKGWKGCESYDSFVKEQLKTVKTAPNGIVEQSLATTQP
jgi:hypothetical protein